MKAVRLTVMRTSVLCSLLSCTSAPATQAQEFTHIVAFGDSFTDNGHIDGHGFNRDSNGKVWVEYLSDKLQAQDLDNRAWGGARTDDGHYLGFDWSGFNWQIDHFELQSKPKETLFTVCVQHRSSRMTRPRFDLRSSSAYIASSFRRISIAICCASPSANCGCGLRTRLPIG